MKVFVYYNLHKHLWSIKALEGENKGRVIAHRPTVWLTNAVPKVSEAGRQRVLKEQRKNVHAGIVGHWRDADMPLVSTDHWRSVTYNPYKYDSFVYVNDESEWFGGNDALLHERKVWSVER
jgi:hypothetical protein